ncbi:hypothetical protein EK21DRAFT_80614 [Setomelanomma holmii]|uniref:LIM zinc-binding domain-containing protein n=1 Tax=Setomelanomma holmii TaxID=210430 RepID=A0A9P4GX12_9PLEO|nr:hypothetical protein EK21DRAFT_80614 [Setomelanomma holmii]
MERASASGLPTIKCSSCGIDIDILQLADHVCAPSPPSNTAATSPRSPPSPPKLDRAATFGGASFSNRSDGSLLAGRMRPPPRIDSNAANKPFRHLEPSPMSNYSDSRNGTPLSPTPPKSPYKMNRSVTTPAPAPRRRLGPPSPTLPSNLDCAFPPFPSKRSATPQSARPQTRDRLESTQQQRYAEPSPLFAPLSPRIDGGDNIAKRMDSIAPGPFDGRADRRPSTSSASKTPMEESAVYGHRRTATHGSTRSVGSIPKQRSSMASTTSRASAYSTRSVGLPAHPKAGISANSTPPPPLPSTSEQNEGIDAFLNRLQKESMRPPPQRENSEVRDEPKRQDSQERKGPPPRPRRPSSSDLPSNSLDDFQSAMATSRPNNVSPSRDHSRNGSDGTKQQVNPIPRSLQPPPLAPPTFRNDTPLNSLHTPSDSGMSDDSYASSGFRSVASSRSSPPGSEAGHSREASKLSQSEYLDENVERTASPDSYSKSRTPPSKPNPERSLENSRSRKTSAPGPQPFSANFADVPESPMDPAIQMGIAFDRPPRQPGPTQVPDSNPGRTPSKRLPDPAPRRQDSRPAKKGKCRGCSEPIVGKSVKDSSGRLTGRYHKQCFVCRTCSDPFPTAEFYVFDNSPYCERHYHELNGSVCTACNRGIEGQYLETDARRKFHPRCFTCTTCRIVLRDDYYEVAGQKYCDRHAQSAAAPPQNFLGPGGYRPRMEKRRTRLMMMA